MLGVDLIAYSTIIANTFVICNLASIVLATENCGSYAVVTKAFELVRDGFGRVVACSSHSLGHGCIGSSVSSEGDAPAPGGHPIPSASDVLGLHHSLFAFHLHSARNYHHLQLL
ncbi:hypothetical protein KSP40_PGU003727 [Platanthera guangdongensis]|uniref:Uncharacterized protein n=1 Tax=Platanthera guangdongensis TaxID=2320717 RepID=A0ABR2LZ49_9ASPA